MISRKLTKAVKSNQAHIIERSKEESAFSQIFKKYERIEDLVIKIEFVEYVKLTQQKNRRFIVQLQEVARKKVTQSLKEKHKKNVSNVNDKMFFQLTVITVEKNKNVNVALDARELNRSLIEEK